MHLCLVVYEHYRSLVEGRPMPCRCPKRQRSQEHYAKRTHVLAVPVSVVNWTARVVSLLL